MAGIAGPALAALLAADLGDPALTGLALSAMGVGTLVSSLAYARRPLRRGHPETIVLVGVLALTVPFTAPAGVALAGLTTGRGAAFLLPAVAGCQLAAAGAGTAILRRR